MRATIIESAEFWLKQKQRVHPILVCYFGDAIRGAVSAEKKMVACNRSLRNAFLIGVLRIILIFYS